MKKTKFMKRYTKEFMDKVEYFTVMAFDVKDSKVLNYMGTKSGRDGDKAVRAPKRQLTLTAQKMDATNE